jgi:hypothetical protein
VAVDSPHMGAEYARVATVNGPRLVLCLLSKGHDLIDERHCQKALTLLTNLDGPTHKKFRTSFEHLDADVRQQLTSSRRLTVATRPRLHVGMSEVSWCRSGVRALGHLGEYAYTTSPDARPNEL